ncbi:MAG TPA: MFS transporter [Bryobacteraceae bacterium]|nr:MFS transporter [Bryobacteraceae bacterium]
MDGPRHKWSVVGTLWVVACLNYLDRQIVFSLFPVLKADLHIPDVQLGLLSSSFLFAYGFASLFAGYAALVFGIGRTIAGSLVVWSLATLLTGFSNSGLEMIGARAVMGLSEALYIPAALALVAALHSTATRSRATALHQSGTYAGIIAGGVLGGWFAQTIGWRQGFWVLGTAGVAYILVLQPALKAAAGASAPVLKQTRPRLKSLFAELSRLDGFFPMLAVFCLFSAAGWLVMTWMPLFLYEKFGMSLVEAGLAATLYLNIGAFSGIFLGGWISDRIGVRLPRFRMWVPAFGFLCSALFLMITINTGSRALLYIALTLFGFGRGLCDCNILPLLCYIAKPDLRAAGYGFLNCGGCITGGVMAGLAGGLKASIGLEGALAASALGLVIAAALLFGPVARVAPSASSRVRFSPAERA